MTTRRAFIKSGALSVFGIGFGGVPAFVAQAAASLKLDRPYKKNRILICIFQRGAMDGLMAVTPFEDKYLRAVRPTIFMSAAKSAGAAALTDLDGRFGLHPAFGAFNNLFKEKQMAIVHGIGSPNNSRSHFDAQDYMESGTPFSKNTSSGWLNRASGLLGHDASPFRAVSMTSSLPRSLYGEQTALAISNLQDFAIRSRQPGNMVNISAKSFEDLYDQATSSLYKDTGKETFEAIKMLEKVDTVNYKAANGAVYPPSTLGNALKQLAQLIKAEVGLEVGFAESGGWDTHFNQGTDQGPFARNAQDLSNSIAAFWTDLGSAWQDEVTVMTMTEFGRTVKQNGSGGTDHGRGSCNFILGHDVLGGRVYGNVQPLAVENLEDGRDLAVTTDFRAVFSEVAYKHLHIQPNNTLFPDWKGDMLRLMKS
jgi:uncharacterized protein (DUF1501 family)